MVEEPFSPGLEGITVAETRLSDVDGEAGRLILAGFPVEEIAPNATAEEVAYLLWNDRLPTASEFDAIRDDLAKRREMTDEAKAVVRTAGREALPAMDALRMGVGAIGLGNGTGDPIDQARTVVARIPTIVATYWAARQHDFTPQPDPSLGHAANYLAMLTDVVPENPAIRGLETYLATVADHGVNASTFTARVITSTESDLVSGVTGAVGALKGPLHGGAPGPVLDMLTEIDRTGDAAGYLTDRLDHGERIMGFGHRVYRVRDPRADILKRAAEQYYKSVDDTAFLSLAETVEETARDILADRYPDRRLDTNVEFYTAILLHAIGIPKELFSATFAIGRASGWTAHCLEQREDNRLIRPLSRYVGEQQRSWKPLAAREVT